MKKPAEIAELMDMLLAVPSEFVSGVEARERFKEVIERAQHAHILITNHGKPQAALLDFKVFQAIQQLVLRMAHAQLVHAGAPPRSLKFDASDNPDEAKDVAEAVERASRRVKSRRKQDHSVAR